MHHYMLILSLLVEGLGNITPPNWLAAQAQLGHLMDMMRLSHGNDWGPRYMAPAAMLWLRQDQLCYDFVKWWKMTGKEDDYAWGDEPERFLNIHGADAFAPIENPQNESAELSHTATLALLKIRIYIDLYNLRHTSESGARPAG